MRLNEMFKTIQCEGIYTGKVSLFARLAGCNLSCRWCDEKFSSKTSKGEEITLEALIEKINNYGCKNIVITGGEPMIAQEIEEITKELKNNKYHVTIETNGTIKKKVKADLISISPKLLHSIPSMDEESTETYIKKMINLDAIDYYIKNYNYQIKFIVKDERDFNEIEDTLSKLKIYNKDEIFITPLASSRNSLNKMQKKIVALCIRKGYRYGNRLQLQIWGKGKENKKHK